MGLTFPHIYGRATRVYGCVLTESRVRRILGTAPAIAKHVKICTPQKNNFRTPLTPSGRFIKLIWVLSKWLASNQLHKPFSMSSKTENRTFRSLTQTNYLYTNIFFLRGARDWELILQQAQIIQIIVNFINYLQYNDKVNCHTYHY